MLRKFLDYINNNTNFIFDMMWLAVLLVVFSMCVNTWLLWSI